MPTAPLTRFGDFIKTRLGGTNQVTPTNGQLRTQRYGGGSSSGTTLPDTTSLSNRINEGLKQHRQKFSNSGNKVSQPKIKGTRGLNQSAANINSFGSTRANAASNSGTAITGSTATQNAINAWNQAKYGKGISQTPQGTSPIKTPSQVSQLAGVTTATTAPGAALFTPVSSNPAGVVIAAGALALGAGLYLGNKLYEGIGSPFGPSLGAHIKAALNDNTNPLSPVNNGETDPRQTNAQEGQTFDRKVWGEDNKRYNITYYGLFDYSDSFDKDRRSRGVVRSGPHFKSYKLGPIGKTIWKSPDSQPQGKHEFHGITSPSSIYERGTYKTLGVVGGAGTNNTDYSKPGIEITDIVEVGNESQGSIVPRTLNNPTNWPSPEELPFTGKPDLGTPTGYDPQADLNNFPEQKPEIDISDPPIDFESPNKTNPSSPRDKNEPEILDPVDPLDTTKPVEPQDKKQELSERLKKYEEKIQSLKVNSATALPLALTAPLLLRPTTDKNKITNPSPPSTLINNPPVTKASTGCGCNGGINAHTDQVGQQLNSKLDDLLGAKNTAQNGLLTVILGFVEQIAQVTGVGAFPVSAPVNLNQKASGTKTINNLAEAHLWQADNLDSTIGGWPNTIQNADTGGVVENLTVSDSLAEIQGLLMAMAIGQGINQQGIFKTLTETTGIKQQSMLARQYAQANAEYLGYNLRQTSRQVPNTYTPGVENIMQLLNPGKIPMEAVENADDMDLQSCLRELCASAAIIRAVFFRNTGTEDVETALRERLDQAKAVNAKDSGFEEYLQQVEQGFGLSQPYGRDASSGPRISDRTNTDTNQTP